MLIDERDTRRRRVLQAADDMMTAARTAPKGKGIDLVEVAVLTDDTIRDLSRAMEQYSASTGMKFIARDAENILAAEAVVLIGTRSQPLGLNCGYCGFATCADKLEHAGVPCALNTTDVGIAIGSAVSVAADRRVDCRVMFSVGRVAKELGYLPGCSSVYGIPVSCTSKNPFFDRK